MHTILFLASNPSGTSPLRLDQEVREIEEGLRRAREGKGFAFRSRWALRPIDVSRAILDLDPTFVHFSGHGSGNDGLVLEGDAGEPFLVSTGALAGLFKLVKDRVRCVLLNACYAEVQALAISEHIEFVIGMSGAVPDRTALAFAVGFYDALGGGRSIPEAFEWGCSAIALAGLPCQEVPRLFKRADAAESTAIADRMPGSEVDSSRSHNTVDALVGRGAPRQDGRTNIGDVVSSVGGQGGTSREGISRRTSSTVGDDGDRTLSPATTPSNWAAAEGGAPADASTDTRVAGSASAFPFPAFSLLVAQSGGKVSVEVTSRQLGLHLTLDLPGGQTRQALGNDFTLDADWRGSKVRLRLLGAVEAAVKGGVVALVTGRGQRTIPLEPRWDSPVSFVEGEEEPVTLLEETVELEEI